MVGEIHRPSGRSHTCDSDTARDGARASSRTAQRSFRPYSGGAGHCGEDATGHQGWPASAVWRSYDLVIPRGIAQNPWATSNRELRCYAEYHVAEEGAAGGRHPDVASGRVNWYVGRDLGRRDHGERSGRPVKADFGRSGRIRPQDFDGRSRPGGGGQRFHKRAEPHRHTEDRALAIRPARRGCPVEVAVGGLNQPAVWVGAISPCEMAQDRQLAA